MIGFYFITDSRLSCSCIISDVKSALKAGVKVVQYREKCKSSSQMFKEAVALRKICKNITFLINDRIDIALAVDADGVHLGQDDLPISLARKLLGKKKIIGVTVHNVKEAVLAERLGADYLGASPIFLTKTKLDAGRPLGIRMLKAIKKRVKIPVVALGGITLKNAKEVICSGSDGICAISAVLTKKNVRNHIKKFQDLFKG